MYGKVMCGCLGVLVQDLNQVLFEFFGLKKVEGVLVSLVEKGSLVDKVGLQVGDVILSFDGYVIDYLVDLFMLVVDIVLGFSKFIQVMCGGKVLIMNVIVGEMKQVKNEVKFGKFDDQGCLGLVVCLLDKDEQVQIGGQKGLLVEDVSGLVVVVGIQSGDVILVFNGMLVFSVVQLCKLVSEVGKNVVLLVECGDEKIFVLLVLN